MLIRNRCDASLIVAAPHPAGFNVTLQPWFDLETSPRKVGYNLSIRVDREITRYRSLEIYRSPANATSAQLHEPPAAGKFINQILGRGGGNPRMAWLLTILSGMSERLRSHQEKIQTLTLSSHYFKKVLTLMIRPSEDIKVFPS